MSTPPAPKAVLTDTGVVLPITGVHPVADLFPMLDEEDLADLVASIRDVGQQHPIVLTADGVILDGRNRAAACERAGMVPHGVLYDGDDPDGYALTVNVTRRHLTKGQRAMVVAKSQVSWGLRGSAAKAAAISTERIRQANVVLVHAPELADAVVAGGVPLDTAYAEARKRKAASEARDSEAREIGRRMKTLRRNAPDLADLVTEERMALGEAEAAHKEREAQARREAEGRNEHFARAITYLVGYTVRGERTAELLAGWDPGNAGDWPTDDVTAENIAAIAEALAIIAKEWNE